MAEQEFPQSLDALLALLSPRFGVLAESSTTQIRVVARNNDVAVGDLFLIPSQRGSDRVYVFRTTQYANIMNRTFEMSDVARNKLTMPDSYFAEDLSEENLLELSGTLLGYAEIQTQGRWSFHRPRRLPDHMADVFRVSAQDKQIPLIMGALFRDQLGNAAQELVLGELLAGEHSLPGVSVSLPVDALSHHIGIFGRTGSGKSNLMMVLIRAVFEHNRLIHAGLRNGRSASFLAIDPHDEFRTWHAQTRGADGVRGLVQGLSPAERVDLVEPFYYLTAREVSANAGHFTPSPGGERLGGNAVEVAPPPNGGRLGGGRSNASEAIDLTPPHPNPPPQGEGIGGANSASSDVTTPLEVQARISRADLTPEDLISIMDFSEQQAAFSQAVYARLGEDWIASLLRGEVPTDEGEAEYLPGTVAAVQRRLGFLEASRTRLVSRFLPGPFPYASLLPDLICALERGRIIVVDTTLLSELEQFLLTTVVARVLFALRKALRSTTEVSHLPRAIQLALGHDASPTGTRGQQSLADALLERLEDGRLPYRVGDSLRSLDELPHVNLVIEEAPSLLNPARLKFGSVFRDISRQGRKFGIGLSVISQQVTAIDSGILTQLNTELTMGLGNEEERRSAIRNASGDLSGFERELLLLGKGQILLTSTFKDVPVPVQVPNYSNKTNGASNGD